GRGLWVRLGAHTDTVPAGGRLDGAYGVLAALEVARTLPGRVAVASFPDEEGVTGHGFAGSMWFCAGPQVELISGYLELHVEQGPRLEAEGLELGVVRSIVGIDRYGVSFRGAANHARTTRFARC